MSSKQNSMQEAGVGTGLTPASAFIQTLHFPIPIHATPRVALRWPTIPSPSSLRLLGCCQLLSYTSDVLIAGASFSEGPPDEVMEVQVPPTPQGTTARAANATPQSHHGHFSDVTDSTTSGRSSSTYLHVVDRLRTLRTWLLHPGGATAVAAYSLPAAAPRVPRNKVPSSKRKNSAPRGNDGTHSSGNSVATGSSPPRAANGPDVGSSPGGGADDKGQHGNRPIGAEDHSDDDDEEEEVDALSLPAGALVAAVLPSPPRRSDASAGSGILVAAGVALSGVSFLPEELEGGGRGGEGPVLWRSTIEEDSFDDGSRPGDRVGQPVQPRVLGMRGLVPRGGAQQALAIVWAERPSFQVLDVSRGGPAGVVEEMLLARRHR